MTPRKSGYFERRSGKVTVAGTRSHGPSSQYSGLAPKNYFTSRKLPSQPRLIDPETGDVSGLPGPDYFSTKSETSGTAGGPSLRSSPAHSIPRQPGDFPDVPGRDYFNGDRQRNQSAGGYGGIPTMEEGGYEIRTPTSVLDDLANNWSGQSDPTAGSADGYPTKPVERNWYPDYQTPTEFRASEEPSHPPGGGSIRYRVNDKSFKGKRTKSTPTDRIKLRINTPSDPAVIIYEVESSLRRLSASEWASYIHCGPQIWQQYPHLSEHEVESIIEVARSALKGAFARISKTKASSRWEHEVECCL